MKTIRKIKRELSTGLAGMMLLFSCSSATNPQEAQILGQFIPPPTENTINIALLLDTSNSMDGLIEQAKSQLWKIVDELSEAKKQGQKANLQIALYEYGNDQLSSRSGYIRKVLPLTSDLDDISEQLFSLTTNGGSEYCGYVIETATNELDWGNEQQGLNAIFIAGNEPFTQGPKNYQTTCKQALNKGITINTIFCGGFEEGVTGKWMDGAKLTEGSYMNIDMNKETVYIETPYDDEINALNNKLNDTYIPFGSLGYTKKSKQLAQDANAMSYSEANNVKRAISKSKHVYKNTSWDLVDALQENKVEIEKIKETELPKEMQGMSVEEKKAYVDNKAKERKAIQNKIQELAKKRRAYVAEKQKESNGALSLDASMIKAIKKQATDRGFVFEV